MDERSFEDVVYGGKTIRSGLGDESLAFMGERNVNIYAWLPIPFFSAALHGFDGSCFDVFKRTVLPRI